MDQNFYKNKKILVTGGTGLIGANLVEQLANLGAHVTVVSIDSNARANFALGKEIRFIQKDLRTFENCLEVCDKQDFVFHLMAVRGNTQQGLTKVASAYVPFLLCNTNVMEAAFQKKIQRFLFVGSIGQYPAIDIRHEDDVWNGAPQANDRYMGIAKRAGEAQAEAYLHEYGWDAVRILRLANVYGPFDAFDPITARVIPALIGRVIAGENPLIVSGDGKAIRDFIYVKDVVDAMLLAMEKAPACLPINIGSGRKHTIREIAETIAESAPTMPDIVWDGSKPVGDPVRLLDVQRARDVLGFQAKISLKEGILKTIDWYVKNQA